VKRLVETLQEIGLAEDESAVYLAALEIGLRPASFIAKKANLKAGHTYNVLERLKARGLIQEIEKSGVKHFSAAPPNRLVSELEEETRALQAVRELFIQALPELTNIHAPRLHQSKVRFFHGRSGVMQVIDEATRTPDKLILAVLDAESQDMFSDDEDIERFLADARAKRIKAQCWYHLLVSGDGELPAFLETDRGRLRITKRLPNIKLPIQFLIHDGKLSVYTMREPQFAVTIDDPLVAESARNLFLYVWSGLPEYSSDQKIESGI